MDPILTIESTDPAAPPAWAVLERRLIDAIDDAAPVFLRKYTRPGGALVWREDYPGDGVWADDLYEAFFNWPFYYALGGSDFVGTGSFEEWNAITRQLTYDYGRATIDVDGPYLNVRLRPGSQIDLQLQLQRFSRLPSFAFPWHSDGIPFH